MTRISIPSSDDASARDAASPSSRNWFKWFLVIGVVAASISLALIDRPSLERLQAGSAVVASPENAPPTAGVGHYPPVLVEATAFPGTGTVTAIIDDGTFLTLFVAESYSGTAVWQSEPGVSAWQIIDEFPGVDIVDAVAFDGSVVAVGVNSGSRHGVVVSGELGSMIATDVGLDQLELPLRVSVVGDEVFVFTRRGDPSLADFAGQLFRSSDGVGFEPEIVGPAAHGVEAVVIRDDRVLAFGRAGSSPAGWDISRPGNAQRLDIDLGDVEGSIRAAAESPTGGLLGLVSGVLGFRLPATEVYNLEPPYEPLTVPLPGIWDRLVVDGETLVALPVEGSRTLVTDDGLLWSPREERFDRVDVGLTPSNEGQSDLPLQIVAYSATANRVVVGGRGGPGGSVPIAGSSRSLGRDFEVPTDAWIEVDELDEGVEVHHFGDIQIGSLNDVVVTRPGFGDPWTQPVFADQPSVGGVTDVLETDLGLLISARRPVPLLWFSRDGDAWEPIARDVVGVASHDGEILIVAQVEAGLRVTRIADGVVERIDSNLSEFGGFEATLGWVDGLGYVSGPFDGALLVSVDGASWTMVEPPISVDEIVMSAGRLGIHERPRTWMGYRSKAEAFEPAALPDLSDDDYRVFAERNLITFVSSSGVYMSRDSIDWIDVSTGIWEGVDGILYGVWLLDDEVIGLIGDSGHRALYRRPLSRITSAD